MNKVLANFWKLSFLKLSVFSGIIIFLAHLSYINNGFTWLDHRDIQQGGSILPFFNILLAFFQRFSQTGFYRPLVTIFNSLDNIVYGSFAPGYHFTNVILHILASVSVPYFLSAFFTLSKKEKILSILIFGLSPLTFLPVGSVSYRAEMLLCIFTFLAVYFYAKARALNVRKFKILAGLSFLLALFSKETAIFLIPALLIFWEASNAKGKDFKIKSSSVIVYFFAVLFIYSILRFWAVPEVWRTSSLRLGVVENIATRLEILGKLFTEFIAPFKPPLSDAIKVAGLNNVYSLLSIFTVLVSFVFVIKNGIKKDSSKAFVLFLILLLPALSIIPTPRLGSPHYGYIALSGFSILLILILRYFQTKQNLYKNLSICLIISWLLISMVSTFLSGFRFKNDLTLFKPEVEKDAGFLEGFYYLGNYYLLSGDFKTASVYYKKVLNPNPNTIAYSEKYSTLLNLSAAKGSLENYKDAEKYLIEAKKLAPQVEQPNINYNLAIIASKEKNYEKAIELLKKDQTYWKTPEPFIILASAYHHLNNSKEAIKSLQKALIYANSAERQAIEALIKVEQEK